MIINNELFKKSLKFILSAEGGYTNHPLDKGGATNKGITQNTYNQWRKSQSLPIQNIKNISDEEAESIYYQLYWCKSGCDNFSPKFAVLCFDTAVNMGIKRNKEFLLAAEYKYPQKFIEARKKAYYRIAEKNPAQKVFLKGWLNRIKRLEKFIDTIN